jgi:hypothetical protein
MDATPILKGFRTIGVGLAIAIVPAALTYLIGVDWTHLVGPNVAMLIAGGLTIAMRYVTDTTIFAKT